jgi:curved DNA-binding protein CbpA
MAALNAFQLLGVDSTASTEEIRSAYFKLAKVSHPDCGGSEDAFRNIKTAYEILRDPSKRFSLGKTPLFSSAKMRFRGRSTSSLDVLINNIEVVGPLLKKS